MVFCLSILTHVLSAFSQRQLKKTQRHLSSRWTENGWMEYYLRTVMTTDNVLSSNLGKKTRRKIVIEESSSLNALLSCSVNKRISESPKKETLEYHLRKKRQ